MERGLARYDKFGKYDPNGKYYASGKFIPEYVRVREFQAQQDELSTKPNGSERFSDGWETVVVPNRRGNGHRVLHVRNIPIEPR